MVVGVDDEMGQTVREEFARWLREQLRSQGWMVSDFAAQVGVRPSAVYRWTAGQRAPTDSQVAKIAMTLRIPTETVWEALALSGVSPTPQPAHPTPRPPRSSPPERSTTAPSEHRFSRWLGDRLAERGWSSGFLARKLELDPVTVRAWLTGARNPASVQFPRIADVFDTSVDTIRGLVED